MRYTIILSTWLAVMLSAAEPGWQQLARFGDGYVVWESNRSGQFRLWQRQLNGSGLAMLTPDDGHEHYAPHICPDGTRIAFFRYAKGTSVYSKKKNPQRGETALCLINRDGSGLKALTQDARISETGGDRGVVWIDDERLIFVNWGGAPCILSLPTGQVEILADTQDACLVNASLTHAFKRVSFMPFDAPRRKITPRKGLGGCEAYVSHDGKWGFWMAGAGGPANRIHLSTGKVSEIVERKDPRFPKDRNYIYFPMVSRCGRLFACGASPGSHDHFTSDYDIFVAAMHPGTLSLIDQPVRYSFDEATDRYPDVYQAELELPQQMGEAPLHARFEAPGNWRWDFGDGVTGQGGAVQHVYRNQGVYSVRAHSGKKVLRGKVIVEAPAAPELISIRLRGANEFELAFNEPVKLVAPKALLEPEAKITATRYGEDRRSLIFTLDREVPSAARLFLEGVQDRAQPPNVLEPAWLEIRPLVWPANTKGLVYVFQTADQQNRVPLADGIAPSYPRKSRGRAHLDHDYAMVLDQGAYTVDGVGDAILAACKEAGALSVEMVLTPRLQAVPTPARMVSFSRDGRHRNFSLDQKGDRLVLRLRTPKTGNNGANPPIELCPLDIDRPQHILVSYRNGQLTAYKHGKLVYSGDGLRGDFRNWDPMQLIFGDEVSGEYDWSGTLEGVAIYSRFIHADEAMETFSRYLNIHRARKKVPSIDLSVTLVEKSRVPTLDEISPYREGLGLFKYKVVGVHAGVLDEKEIYIAHWLIMDNQVQPAAKRKPGAQLRFRVERFDDNPQLRSFFFRNDFNDGDALLADHYFAIE
jgi:hypothetical protein